MRLRRMAQKTNVLLVDDDLTVRQSLQQVLMQENFHVVTAANGLDAMCEFGRNSIDIVLLDINLGPESGWDTFEKLRTIRPRLPIIMMTGQPQEQRTGPLGGVELFMTLAGSLRKLGQAGRPPYFVAGKDAGDPRLNGIDSPFVSFTIAPRQR